MGEPVRIFDMAQDMIALFGLKPFDDIDIVFTGMRPGEKLFEELNTDGENITKTRHPKIYIGTINTYDDRVVVSALAKFEELGKVGGRGSCGRFSMSSCRRRGWRNEFGIRNSELSARGGRRVY